MAKVKLDPIVEQVRGHTLHIDCARRSLYEADLSDHEATPGQLEARERFRQAAVYGRMALADPTVRVSVTVTERLGSAVVRDTNKTL